MQWWNPCCQQHQPDRAVVGKCGKSCRAPTLTQPCSGCQAGQPGAGTQLQPGEEQFKERLEWVAGSRNTSHPFRLWKAVKAAGRSELISSIKTWLYLFQLALQNIKAQTSKPQGSSLLNHYAQWEMGQLGELGGSWHTAAVDPFTVPAQRPHDTAHITLQGHSLPCASLREQHPSGAQPEQLQEFQIPPGSLSNALKWHWSHRTNKLGSFPPIINFYFTVPALFRLDSSPLSFLLPPLILYQNGSRTN